MNNHDGTFTESAAAAGLGAVPVASRRGAAFGDVANDGNVDVLLLNVGEAPTFADESWSGGKSSCGISVDGDEE